MAKLYGVAVLCEGEAGTFGLYDPVASDGSAVPAGSLTEAAALPLKEATRVAKEQAATTGRHVRVYSGNVDHSDYGPRPPGYGSGRGHARR